MDKQQAKHLRREAYLKAKAARDADPKYQAQKAREKEQARAARKEHYAEQKAEMKARKRAERLAALPPPTPDEELWRMIVRGSDLHANAGPRVKSDVDP